ncbi:hypothetical protein QBC37DRAFT_298510 [Rhypophila decipiens]|uniref:Uncharacterized protein n=1 Tax=Rhypophila decipiens TaxID=261697 RepID=A0AAN6XZT6_9PEZI|nr:hypothetical protein QBC37DRAFT_298510 [Rhypophila decipiens]
MVSLPGSYPLDDSAPATPDEPATQPQRQLHHSLRDSLIAHHHDQNVLQKPQDPRSHQPDLGTAGTGLAEAQPSKAHEQPVNEFGATGGGYYTHEPLKPSSAVEAGPVRRTAPQEISDHQRTVYDTHRDTHQDTVAGIQQDIQRDVHEPARETRSSEQAATLQTGQGSSSRSDNDNGSEQHSGSSESPPYWGNLPKGQRGGIYNTVTGHGSPKDDHEQHHHVQDRSPRTDRSHIPGPVKQERNTTRLYNTIAGHGSQDEESKRHNAPSARSESATIASTDAVHHAPLVGIREKPFQSGLTSTKIPSSDLGMGFLPETAAQDDTKLLSRHEDRIRSEEKDRSRAGPTVGWATEMSGPKSNESHTSSGPKSDTMHQRAFPLGPSNMLSGEDADESRSSATRDTGLGAGSHDAIKKDNDTSDSHRNAMLAGAGALGTGIAASEMADRRETKKESTRSASEDRHGRNRLSKLDKKHKDYPSSGSEYSTGRQSLEGKKSRSKSRGREEGSPKSEGMTHKILGIFGLNKDDKKPQDTSTTEPPKETSPRHSSHEHGSHHGGFVRSKNDKELPDSSTTESTPRHSSPEHSSHHGVFARNKNDKQLPDTPTHEPAKESSSRKSPKEQSPRRSGDKKKEAALGAAAGAGALGLMNRHKDEDKSKHRQEAKHHGIHQPTAQPSGPGPMEHRAQGPFGEEQQPSGPVGRPEDDHTVHNFSQPNFSQPIHSDRSKAAPMAAAGIGAVAGAGAYQAAHRQDDKSQGPPSAANYGVQYPTAPTRQAPSQPQAQTAGMGSGAASAANQPGNYNAQVVTQKPGDYNMLQTGTASGVKSHQQPQGTATQKPGDYNMLHSGTASGVATGAAMGAASGVRSHQQPQGTTTQKPVDYDMLHSGTASGVATGTGTSGQKKESHRRGSTGAYNHLASGTPSGVVVEPRRHRASEDHGRSGVQTDTFKNQPPIPSHSRTFGAGTANNQQQSSYQMPSAPNSRSTEQQDAQQGHDENAHKGFISVPITARSPRRHDHHSSIPKPEKKSSISETDNADRVRHMSPEVMPSAYTTSSPARTGHGSNDPSSAAQAQHMSPEVMPSAYTSAVPRSGPEMSTSTGQSQGQVRPQGSVAHSHPHSGELDPAQAALAAATGAWASSTAAPGGPASMYHGPTQHQTAGGNGQGMKKVMHTCEHCGKDNDITAFLASQKSI